MWLYPYCMECLRDTILIDLLLFQYFLSILQSLFYSLVH